MSVMSANAPAARGADVPASILGSHTSEEVVEVSLLLPAAWRNALIELSARRDQSVGQILRALIGRALRDGDLPG
jgi:hypothetical protein